MVETEKRLEIENTSKYLGFDWKQQDWRGMLPSGIRAKTSEPPRVGDVKDWQKIPWRE
jgi:hypothetical protein